VLKNGRKKFLKFLLRIHGLKFRFDVSVSEMDQEIKSGTKTKREKSLKVLLARKNRKR
jgi:hypothetical protein